MVTTLPPADGPLDRVVIVIPTLNEERHIEAVLRQVIEGDPVAAASPVFVADGGSTDRTGEIVTALGAEFPNLRLLHNPGRTQAAALNMALEGAFGTADILIRCDAHAAYPERFVSRLVEAMRAQRADSVAVPMDAMAESGCFQRGLAWIADSKLGAGGSAHRGGTASGFVDHGHHAAFRLAAFTALGGYDTGFRANEDAEYDRRLTDAGGRIWLDGGIRIGYFPRSTPGGLLKQYYHYGRGRAQTCLKHRIRPKLRQLIPVVNLVLLAASLALVPFTAMGLLWPLVYGALLAGAAVSSALRHGSPCALWGGPAIGIMHIAWGYGFLTRIAGIGRSGR